MQRVYVEEGIYIIIGKSGKVSAKCFEVAKRRKYKKLGDAMKLFKLIFPEHKNVYIYETAGYFMVEYKAYTDSYNSAVAMKSEIEAILGEL